MKYWTSGYSQNYYTEPKNGHSTNGKKRYYSSEEEGGKENIANYTRNPHKERRNEEECTNKQYLTRSTINQIEMGRRVVRVDHNL